MVANQKYSTKLDRSRPMDFKIGDVVRVKSGGPTMTIQEIDASLGTADCRWFVGKKDQHGEFVLATLEKAGKGIVGVSSTRRLVR
jgi:uncharacterized protein YodC (DUF2158 family)